MLAKKRFFEVGKKQFETPMLIPSFSSRGFDDVKQLIRGSSPLISEEILISAYDIYYNNVRPATCRYSSLVFIDSGGYEKGALTDLTDTKAKVHYPKLWRLPLHKDALNTWDFSRPTVVISYDDPKRHVLFNQQIERANKLFREFPNSCPEILLKSETKAEKTDPYPIGYLNFENLEKVLPELEQFEIIGVTEKELGTNFLQRMENISLLRTMLQSKKWDKPIHVFGSLDPISTPFYFFAGADIFDGLTWLRFAYKGGVAIYRHNLAAAFLALTMDYDSVSGHIHSMNYVKLRSLESEMDTFLSKEDFSVFEYHSDLFEKSVKYLDARLKTIQGDK